jgi:hypothetical protein
MYIKAGWRKLQNSFIGTSLNVILFRRGLVL